MPIKFACEHCGQVLSVSSTKAGKSAKCPKCHAPIVVPTAEAASATLARRKPALPAAEPSRSEPPRPLPSQEPAGAPSPAESPAVGPPNAGPSISGPEPPAGLWPAETSSESSGNDDPFAQFVVYDDGVELVYASDEEHLSPYQDEIDRGALAVPRSVLYLQGVLLAVVALVCFTLGVIVGGAANTGGKSTTQREAHPCEITGTVSFKDRRKEFAPDDGAVIIVLPQESRPDEKASILGLTPQDQTPDGDHASIGVIRSLGGDYARADAQGRFKLRVSDTGSYYVLIISRNTKRKPTETFKTADLAQLGRYFSAASELIGENQYRWSSERIQSNRTLSLEFN